MGNEHHMAYGARFLFGTRPMIDFESGNEHYGGAFRYFGLGAIFPTQSLRAAGIWILSTQFFRLPLALIVPFDFVFKDIDISYDVFAFRYDGFCIIIDF